MSRSANLYNKKRASENTPICLVKLEHMPAMPATTHANAIPLFAISDSPCTTC